LFAPTRAALVAILLASLGVLAVGAPAHAADADTQPTVATLRAQADAMAGRYFDALARYQSLGLEIATNREQTGALVARARRARNDARVRAVMVYRTSPSRVASIVGSADALSAARRVRFIDRLNARDQAIFARLRAATEDLKQHRRTLKRDLREQEQALGELREQSVAIDAKLALAQQQERLAAAAFVASTAAAAAATRQSDATPTDATPTDATQAAAVPSSTAAPAISATAAPAPETVPSTTSAPVTPTAAPASAPPAAPAQPTAPAYEGTPGAHPRHDDPFLTCVRARESGGNYSIVSADGLYYGAYQFLKTTWNSTANHAGRPELVGVPPNQASVYDQDDMAWALYQWQGAAPWGGYCT
jgi:Transglycosylase-like domain